MRLAVAVQAHPSRSALLPPLVAALPGAEIVLDPDPGGTRSAWRTYRRCLETTPGWATHRLVIQDDASPCRGLLQVLDLAVAAQPEALLVLCVCGQPVRAARAIVRAAHTDVPWVRFHDSWVPAIAVVWPASVIEAALAYVDQQAWPPAFTADDEIIGRIARELRLPVLATAPSLVAHDDQVESVGRRRSAHGRNPGRVTACPLPDNCDPLTFDWALRPS